MNLQTRLTNSTTHKDPQRSCTPERSENSSSSLQTCSLTNSRKPSLLTIIQEKEEENKELRQELQSMKEQNSMLSWQVSILKQELTEDKLIYSSAMQELQSKVAELTEEIAVQKQQKSKILMLCQSLSKENDDLRNNLGILTRKQVESVLVENARLKDELDSYRY